MTSKMICHLAERLMRHPAVPYHEHAPRAEVENICAEHGLSCEQDRFGNLLISLNRAARQRPVVLAAHLDHPGFEIARPLSASRWLARFRGGVPDVYFRSGIPLRLMPGDMPAKLGQRRGPDKAFEIRTTQSGQDTPKFAVWELEDFAVRRGRIYGRACDDLIGVAAVLATLIELKRERAQANVLGVISRAEEVGFHGALACAAHGGLPKHSFVISLETSRELPGVKMGQGVILRVGDRTSIFDPAATRFLAEVAAVMKLRQPSFAWQRALMSGGTCEATAYQEFGFQTAAVCVALGNYHNCAEGNRIRAEYVSISDVCSMVELLAAAAAQMPHYSQLIGKLPQRLNQMLREACQSLPGSAGG
jgi:endoglucanase